MGARLQDLYKNEIASKLSEEFGYQNVHQIPKLQKIVVNMGVGEAAANSKLLDKAAEELGLITGQKPSIRRARKSIANFKLRAGQPIGCTVTLRGERMWEFFDRRAGELLAGNSRADHLPGGGLRQGGARYRGQCDRVHHRDE